jgi:hypothetical protein
MRWRKSKSKAAALRAENGDSNDPLARLRTRSSGKRLWNLGTGFSR